jgi:hypothetical protein
MKFFHMSPIFLMRAKVAQDRDGLLASLLGLAAMKKDLVACRRCHVGGALGLVRSTFSNWAEGPISPRRLWDDAQRYDHRERLFDYKLGAKAGQKLFVERTVAGTNGDGTINLNVLPPCSDGAAIHAGSNDTDTFATASLPSDGQPGRLSEASRSHRAQRFLPRCAAMSLTRRPAAR